MVKSKIEKDYFDRNGYSYLVDHFYAFYSELVALKRQFSAQLESGAEAGIANDDQNLSENAKSVSRQLIGVLELHHIDGNHSNNELSNLTLLCPNCHALTDNYRGKNK